MNKLEQFNSNNENVWYEEIENIIYELNTYVKLFKNDKISKDDLGCNIRDISDRLQLLYEYFPSEVHDLNNIILFFRGTLENEKYLKYIEKDLDKFLQKKFTEKEIMDLSSNISKQLWLELDFNIFKSYKVNSNWFIELNIIFNNNWEVISLDKDYFLYNRSIKDKLFELLGVKLSLSSEDIKIKNNLSMNFKWPIHSIILNTMKNAKEAWATKIKVMLLDSIFSDMVMLKVIDNASWMDENTIKNILFKKWVSTKSSSWTNMWVWMYELVKNFLSNEWEVELYSKRDWEMLEFYYHKMGIKKDNIKPLINHNRDSLYNSIYEPKISWNSWTEFVFKFRN